MAGRREVRGVGDQALSWIDPRGPQPCATYTWELGFGLVGNVSEERHGEIGTGAVAGYRDLVCGDFQGLGQVAVGRDDILERSRKACPVARESVLREEGMCSAGMF